jgi:hypothetical protein
MIMIFQSFLFLLLPLLAVALPASTNYDLGNINHILTKSPSKYHFNLAIKQDVSPALAAIDMSFLDTEAARIMVVIRRISTMKNSVYFRRNLKSQKRRYLKIGPSFINDYFPDSPVNAKEEEGNNEAGIFLLGRIKERAKVEGFDVRHVVFFFNGVGSETNYLEIYVE